MYSFEDKLIEIETALERKRSKWNLNAVVYIDYDDIKQIIITHIYKKWHLWDQSQPIEPWLSTVVSNQFRNLLRNYYGNYARPCLKCPHNMGGTDCSITKDGVQGRSCPQYNSWATKKQPAYNIKLATTMENHIHELHEKQDTFANLEEYSKKLQDSMRKRLSEKHFQAFKMLFFENKSEEDVAKYLGFKTSEKKRCAGYKQIKNLKKVFQQKTKKALDDLDFI